MGAELTHEELRAELEKIRPDFVQCDCKGHPGYASYPTKVGSPSPGIVRDALRIHRDVTAAMGIPLSVHYSGIIDARAVELHPDWAAMEPDGSPILSREGKAPGIVCPRGPYVDELMIPQLLEIIDEYDVDGFWVDGDNWAVCDYYCPRCRRELTRRTGIAEAPTERAHPDWPAWRAFQRDSFVEYVTRFADAVRAAGLGFGRRIEPERFGSEDPIRAERPEPGATPRAGASTTPRRPSGARGSI